MSPVFPSRSAVAVPEVIGESSAVPDRRILVLAPTGNDAFLTAQVLARSRIEVKVCPDVAALGREMEGGCAAILLAEEALTANSVPALVSALAQQAAWSDLPVIIITSGGEADQARLRRLAAFGPASNVTLLERPFRPGTLISTAEVALRARLRQYQMRDLLQTVQASEARYQYILASISDAFIALDREWRVTYINSAYLQLVAPLGLSSDDLVGQNFWGTLPVRPELEFCFRSAMATLKSDAIEVFYPPLQVWLEVRVYPAPETLTIYLRDITERKRTEERLRHSDAQVTAIIKNSPVGVYLVDSELRIQQVNLKAEPIFGDITDLIGRSFGDVLRVLWPEAVAGQIESRFQSTLANGESYFESGFAVERADKNVREYYDWQIHRVTLPDGRFGVVCYFIDISSHIAAQNKIREARDISEQANRAKDDFLAALSHELRTPLNPVLLLATEAAANPNLSADLRANFDMIAKNVLLEAHLIDDLLDLTRITRGKLVLDTRVVSVHEIIQDAIANVKTEVSDKQLNLTVNFCPENPLVNGDPVRLQQVFWNVLKNAVKFTSPHGRITVITRIISKQGPLLVEIFDSGVGMSAGEISRIFDAFSQGDHASLGSTHRFGGLGLGLAISRSLVELHSGRIRASSPGIGQGSTFTIELPLAPVPNSRRAESNASVPARQNSNPPLRGIRILLVEDHDPTRAVLARLLQIRNHRVVTAGSVSEARKFGATQTFDLLITDIGLPDGNGYELMEEMGKLPHMKGIALTGYGAEQDVERAQKTGFIAHLTKPVSVRTLDGVLESVGISIPGDHSAGSE